jgi:hypothetical protein
VIYIDKYRLPRDISQTLVFTSYGLQDLSKTIVRHNEERNRLTQDVRDSVDQYVLSLLPSFLLLCFLVLLSLPLFPSSPLFLLILSLPPLPLLLSFRSEKLQANLVDLQKKIAVAEEKCVEIQKIKFGQKIDLNILTKAGADQGTEELRARLKQYTSPLFSLLFFFVLPFSVYMLFFSSYPHPHPLSPLLSLSSLIRLERESSEDLSDWDKRIQQAKDQLHSVSSANTKWLERVAQLTKQQYDLENQLNNTTKNVHVCLSLISPHFFGS